jgi:hypothetical protein
MDLWTFQRFQEPVLCVDSIDYEIGTNVINLRAGEHSYRLAVDDTNAAAQLAVELTALQEKNAPLWTTLKQADHETAWFAIGSFLDQHSLIQEGRQDAEEKLRSQAERIWTHVEETVKAVFSDISAERMIKVSCHAAALSCSLDHLTRSQKTLRAVELNDDPFDAIAQPNFYLALLNLEFKYLSQASPHTLVAIQWLLAQVQAIHLTEEFFPDQEQLTDCAGLFDEQDLVSHLWLAANSLLWSTGTDSSRFPTSPIPVLRTSSGLEFMRQIELMTRDTLTLWGENAYITSIDKLNGGFHPLVAGPFIEQYHVTRRFVEIITPLLHTRLSRKLRRMAFQYYSEESGHEALESTTCEALGVSEEILAEIIPLPLHYAFVDLLTLLALYDPITSFASVMTIEGIFGEPPRMSLRLAAAARDDAAFRTVMSTHDDLNLSLNHNSISRDMFEQVTAVNAKDQLSTILRILFLLELNHRAWSHIESFYGSQTSLQVQGLYGNLIDTMTN